MHRIENGGENCGVQKRWPRCASSIFTLRTFNSLPCQTRGLTDLLLRDCNSALTRITQVIDDWSPTDILAPSLFDIHPDHNAVAVMMRLIFADFLAPRISQWNYLVHGRSPAFFDRAARIIIIRIGDRQQNAKQFAAIKRKSNYRGDVFLDTPHARSVFFVSTARALSGAMARFIPFVERGDNLNVDLRFTADPFRMQRSKFFILGRDSLGRKRACEIRLPGRSADLKCWIARRIAALASPVTGAIHLPASSRFHCTCFRRSTICLSKSIDVRGSSMRPVGSRFQVCRV